MKCMQEIVEISETSMKYDYQRAYYKMQALLNIET